MHTFTYADTPLPVVSADITDHSDDTAHLAATEYGHLPEVAASLTVTADGKHAEIHLTAPDARALATALVSMADAHDARKATP